MDTDDSVNHLEPAIDRARVVVGRVHDLPPGRGATVELSNGEELALFNVGGAFHAVENICPHKGAPLSEGQVRQFTLECPLHGWEFDLRDGRCLTVPDCDIRRFEVVVENGEIVILL